MFFVFYYINYSIDLDLLSLTYLLGLPYLDFLTYLLGLPYLLTKPYLDFLTKPDTFRCSGSDLIYAITLQYQWKNWLCFF